MSRSRKKHPQWSCPRGRRNCWACRMFGFGNRPRFKRLRLTGERGR